MNKGEVRRTFFYAMQEAGMYDATIEWVAPYYQQMHQMMLRLALESVDLNDKITDQHTLALDIGFGTGAEAIPLLRTIPSLRLVGLDLCEPMRHEFNLNAQKQKVEKDRYCLEVGDILDPSISERLRSRALETFGANEFQLIISAFTIHHLTMDQKARVFRLIHSLLSKDGVFLLGDLFNYDGESAWLTNTVFHWEVGWMAQNFEAGQKEAERDGDNLKAERLRQLKTRWIDHYMSDNKLDSVKTQLALLHEAGFSQVGNPFRYWQVGLLWARK